MTLRTRRGFTIVELLIVIVVIGILAAIIIVAYVGITKRTTIASLQSDLSAAARVLENDKTVAVDGGYPATLSAANGGKGIKGSNGAGFQYTVDNGANPKLYCLTVTNGLVSYYVDQTGVVKEGFCPGHVAPADNKAIVTTLAGSDTAGSANGTGTNAQFSEPYGIAIDNSTGNLYVADSMNHTIRKITSAGVVTTFAGTVGVTGSASGNGTSAQFNTPRGIAFDASGNLFVADYQNSIIRKITPAADVSSYAGSSSGQGSNNANGSSARFFLPRGVVADSAGNVFVADTSNNRIRKITPARDVTTFVGSSAGFTDGTGTSAQFSDPRALTIDSADNLYVADTYNNAIRKVTPSGVVTTLAGTSTAGYADGTGTNARFNDLTGITFSSDGNLYVADTANNRIRKVTTTGVVTTIAGSNQGYADGIGTNAQFYYPRGIAAGAGKILYVADTYNNRIRKIELP